MSDGDIDLPGPPAARKRSIHPDELETIIGRALELQSELASGEGGELEEGELVRIGLELGLDPATMRRATAEVRLRREGPTVVTRLLGERYPSGRRVVDAPSEELAASIERYLHDAEQMVPERRLGDRTRYVRDASWSASIARLKSRFSGRHRPLDSERVEVAVTALDHERSLVEVAVDLREAQLGFTIASCAMGIVPAAVVLLVNGVASPWALMAPAFLAAPWLFFRGIYSVVRRQTQERLESLLDRITHDELD